MVQGMQTRLIGRSNFWQASRDLWTYRHLTFHLAKADIESRFRRSSLGVLWAMVHPLAFTILYSLVLSSLFKQEFKDYAIYVFSGFVLWNAISAYANLGTVSFLNAVGYLKQAPIPLIVFPARVCISVTMIYFIELASFALFTLALIHFSSANAAITIMWFWAFPIGVALLLFGIPIATLAAFLNVHFRDTQQFLLIGTQAVWFASPIFFDRELFDAPAIKIWTSINPVAAFCDVFRSALIFGQSPPTQAWIVIGCWVGILWVLAMIALRWNSRRIVMLL